MPQGSHMKGRKSNPKKAKITKVSKKGSSVTKKTPKRGVPERKKLQKALESTIKANVENEVRAKAGGSSLAANKKPAAAAAKGKAGRKGKKK